MSNNTAGLVSGSLTLVNLERIKPRRIEIPKRRLNILFTCVGRRVVLMQSFRRAMEQLGVTGKLVATDITPAAAALQVADAQELVPKTGSVEYVPALLKIVKRHKIGLLVPLTDLDLRCLSRRSKEFEELGCTVMVGSESDVKICRDKKRFSQRISNAGLPGIRTMDLKEFRKKPFYPCFVKPIKGSAGIGSARIKDGNELRRHTHVFGERMLVQDYVPGQEFTIDVYRTRDGEVKAVVPRQRLMVRGGEVDQGITVMDQELIDATLKLADIMSGLWGVYCCQCRREPGKEPYFFEINPRFGGGSPLSIQAGADMPLYLLQEVLGKPVGGEVGKFTPNLLMMRYSAELFQQIDDPADIPGYDNPMFK